MAYSDYGAFVWCNGRRRQDKEDVATFATDEETFGMSSDDIPSGLRIWVSLLKQRNGDKDVEWVNHIHHGVMGDGNIRVMCHKQGLPEIYEATETGFEEIKYYDDDTSSYDYGTIEFEYKDHKFVFESGEPYRAVMTEPDGTVWECEYDYGFGAGFEEGVIKNDKR